MSKNNKSMIDSKTRKGSIMTQKEFFESIMNSDVITEEMKTHAADELAKIEARAEKRKTTRNQRMTDSRKQFSRASLRERR